MNEPATLRQSTFDEDNAEYKAFLDKFKPKKTTDDCYTPPNVYDAVRTWVFRRYALPPETEIVRPFWPGASYETRPYLPGCVVLDNPPFSIVGRIVDFYQSRRIRFFLFAPYLSNIGIGRGTGCGHVLAPHSVLYQNGAEVPTSFVTNLDPDIVAESAPDLLAIVKAADDHNRASTKKVLPTYQYPDAIVTSASLGFLATHATPFSIRRGDCVFVRALDVQRAKGKSIFGGGLLLSERAAAERAAAERAAAERAAAERAAAERLTLSDRERQIQSMLAR